LRGAAGVNQGPKTLSIGVGKKQQEKAHEKRSFSRMKHFSIFDAFPIYKAKPL